MNNGTELVQEHVRAYLNKKGYMVSERWWNHYIAFLKKKTNEEDYSCPGDISLISINNVCGFVYLVCMEKQYKGFYKLLSFDKNYKNPFSFGYANSPHDYAHLIRFFPKLVTHYLITEIQYVNITGEEHLGNLKKRSNESSPNYNYRVMDTCLKVVDEYRTQYRTERMHGIIRAETAFNDILAITVYQSRPSVLHTSEKYENQVKELYNSAKNLSDWAYGVQTKANNTLAAIADDRISK